MKKNVFILLLMGLSVQIHAQRNQRILAIETDPMTTVFGARTLSVIVEPLNIKHWSLFTNVVSADFPSWMDDLLNPNNKDKSFESKIKFGGGFAVDYFIKAEREGMYVGVINLLFNNLINNDGSTTETISHNIIPRAGYRWYPFEKANFYLNPFLGVRYEYIVGEEQTVAGEIFEAAGFGPFGTMHLGYHF